MHICGIKASSLPLGDFIEKVCDMEKQMESEPLDFLLFFIGLVSKSF